MSVEIPAPRPSNWSYLLVVALAYLVVRIVAAVFFVWVVHSGPGLDSWNRIANVWLFPEPTREALLDDFLSRAKEDHKASGRRDVILVAGDSQLYGYYLPAPKTAAARLQALVPGASVYNASRLSGSYSWAYSALKSAIDSGLAPRVLVVNANPAIQGTGPIGDKGILSRWFMGSLVAADGTLGLFVEVLRGMGRKGAPPFDPYDELQVPPGDGSYLVASLGRDYYPAQLPRSVASGLESLLAHSRGKVDLVVVVASPHHYAPYNEAPFRYGWDTRPIVRESMAICARFAHAACLDLSQAYGREYFHDVVHLNEKGQRRLAAEIAEAIRSRLGEPGRVSR